MKVLHYVPNFSVTTETFIYDQIKGIENAGIESAVLTAKRSNMGTRPFNNVYLGPFKKLINERVTAIAAFRFQLLPYFIDYKAWERAINEFKPDVIHCHAGNALKTWMHVSEKLNIKIPTLISMHGSDVNSEPLIRRQYKRTLMRAGQKEHVFWTVPSLFLKTKAIQNLQVPGDKITVVYNAVNRNFLNVSETIDFTEPRLVCVGRFIKCKGHEYLIRAFSKVLKQYSSASLTLIGNGPLKSELHELVKELGIGHAIKFIDSIAHSALPSELIKHNLYIQPSIKDEVSHQEESFGVAAIEAAVAGLPTIITDCGGLGEVAKESQSGDIRVVRQFDVQALTISVSELFLRRKAISIQNREALCDTFSSNRNIGNITKLYKKLVENSSCQM